ncbi:hypothetical protein [Streptomyces sp. NPDC096030]|uniref:hypothetical protein n=1 Tax=Streptomyces sp. NPDC096030 TaxID=3155423 RepID=UPI00331F1D0F
MDWKHLFVCWLNTASTRGPPSRPTSTSPWPAADQFLRMPEITKASRLVTIEPAPLFLTGRHWH